MINGKKAIKILVKDSGIGIKPSDSKNLFQMFAMVDSSRKINKSGTGFGLYISNELSKYLSHKHNKGIQISSEFGKGSTFYFTLENKKYQMPEVLK
jgi:signal transduction histidine kinase